MARSERETVIEMGLARSVAFGATLAGPHRHRAMAVAEEKPVGTVWIGWKRRGGYTQAELFHFDGDREAVRRQTVAASLRGLLGILG